MAHYLVLAATRKMKNRRGGCELVVLGQQTAPKLSPDREKGYHGVPKVAETVEDQQRLFLVVPS